MLMTVLEAHVSQEKRTILEKAYKTAIENVEPGIIQTFLLNGAADSNLWRIITLWRSRKDLDEMRKLGTPKGILIFREAGAEPKLTVFDVVAHA